MAKGEFQSELPKAACTLEEAGSPYVVASRAANKGLEKMRNAKGSELEFALVSSASLVSCVHVLGCFRRIQNKKQSTEKTCGYEMKTARRFVIWAQTLAGSRCRGSNAALQEFISAVNNSSYCIF